MNKLVWKYFFEQKKEELKTFFRVTFIIIGGTAVFFGISTLLGFIALSVYPPIIVLVGPISKLAVLNYLSVGVLLLYFVLLVGIGGIGIFMFFKWIHSNWREAKRRSEIL